MNEYRTLTGSLLIRVKGIISHAVIGAVVLYILGEVGAKWKINSW